MNDGGHAVCSSVLCWREGDWMARYLARACPRCNGHVGIVIRERGRDVPLQAVNGRCTRASFTSLTNFIAQRLLGS
jgi:hypothetical protein